MFQNISCFQILYYVHRESKGHHMLVKLTFTHVPLLFTFNKILTEKRKKIVHWHSPIRNKL